MTEQQALRNTLPSAGLADYITTVRLFLQQHGIPLKDTSSAALAPELAALESHLTSLLRPVRPTSAFRAKLQRELLAAARRRELPAESPFSVLRRRPVVIGAAIAGSVLSVAGAAAYIYRYHRLARARANLIDNQ